MFSTFSGEILLVEDVLAGNKDAVNILKKKYFQKYQFIFHLISQQTPASVNEASILSFLETLEYRINKFNGSIPFQLYLIRELIAFLDINDQIFLNELSFILVDVFQLSENELFQIFGHRIVLQRKALIAFRESHVNNVLLCDKHLTIDEHWQIIDSNKERKQLLELESKLLECMDCQEDQKKREKYIRKLTDSGIIDFDNRSFKENRVTYKPLFRNFLVVLMFLSLIAYIIFYRDGGYVGAKKEASINVDAYGKIIKNIEKRDDKNASLFMKELEKRQKAHLDNLSKERLESEVIIKDEKPIIENENENENSDKESQQIPIVEDTEKSKKPLEPEVLVKDKEIEVALTSENTVAEEESKELKANSKSSSEIKEVPEVKDKDAFYAPRKSVNEKGEEIVIVHAFLISTEMKKTQSQTLEILKKYHYTGETIKISKREITMSSVLPGKRHDKMIRKFSRLGSLYFGNEVREFLEKYRGVHGGRKDRNYIRKFKPEDLPKEVKVYLHILPKTLYK